MKAYGLYIVYIWSIACQAVGISIWNHFWTVKTSDSTLLNSTSNLICFPCRRSIHSIHEKMEFAVLFSVGKRYYFIHISISTIISKSLFNMLPTVACVSFSLSSYSSIRCGTIEQSTRCIAHVLAQLTQLQRDGGNDIDSVHSLFVKFSQSVNRATRENEIDSECAECRSLYCVLGMILLRANSWHSRVKSIHLGGLLFYYILIL